MIKSNKENYDKILQIIDVDEYSDGRNNADFYIKKFNRMRNALYIVLYIGLFYFFLEGRLISENLLVKAVVIIIVGIVAKKYSAQKQAINEEYYGFFHRDCRPDIAISRYLAFVSAMLNKQCQWNIIYYNFGLALYRQGEINKANAFLGLMQDSTETAMGLFRAEHLKQLIAFYYKDYDTVITCSNEAGVTFSKLRQNKRNKKIYDDMLLAGAYAVCCKNNDYQQILSLLQDAKEYSLDEVVRHYYLYLAAKEINDSEKADYYRSFVRNNAGTTWYGNAVEDGFIPEEKPENYPGFCVSSDKLNNPLKIDRSRIKYLLLGTLIVVLLFVISRLL
ncbi:hypothetical protein [Butyrivibrio sp. INlla21]|uniref:hypothetical protein n=1 Tax=Butyrivibrio sp. INlla21 TaxID=1520811 RepID=UPI001160C2BA|nr:hypothetical protein [Butyrivibrio sp. INlla21]